MSSRTFRSNDSANVAMMFGLLMFPLMAAAGMAIDMMRISNEKTEIAEALDAGLLAAARAYMFDNSLTKAEATAIARKSFDANFTPTAGTTISDFNFNQIPGQQKYTLKLEGEMKTALLGAIGRKTVDLDMDAEAQVRLPGPIEVVMVLDNTGSMAGTKLSDLQDAAKELIDTLEGVDLAEFSYGLVPFSEYVNVDTANSGASWLDETAVGGSTWDGCVGSRSSSNDRVDANYATEQVPAVVGVQCPPGNHAFDRHGFNRENQYRQHDCGRQHLYCDRPVVGIAGHFERSAIYGRRRLCRHGRVEGPENHCADDGRRQYDFADLSAA